MIGCTVVIESPSIIPDSRATSTPDAPATEPASVTQ
jgi:hypothetical protein